jgi:signal transduction histidine kinase
VRVGTRITAATSALVTLTLGTYAFFDLRAAAGDRRAALETEARDMAIAVRAGIEAAGARDALSRQESIAASLERAGTPWEVAVVPVQLVQAQTTGRVKPQLKRLRAMLEESDQQDVHVVASEDARFVYAVPLRVPSVKGFDIIGSLEVSRSTAYLSGALGRDIGRTLPVLAVIVILTVLAINWLTQSVMTRPVTKLLAGIDDVAHGDLSRVLLSERDDEIGALATRFNDMTYSLRESQAETQRQNEARLQLEQRLNQTEKLATIGQLAAEIAHEVGTPLNVIAGRSKRLIKRSSDPTAVEKSAVIISEQTGRITRIIQRLLDFTRRKVGTSEPASVDLNDIALVTMELLEGQLAAANVTHALVPAAQLPPIKGDTDRLQQVLLNLLLNAIQAMPDGGALRVETEVVNRRRPGLAVAPEQDYAVVRVIDSGVGIPPERRDKIFEPFYTSRAGIGGTGLGLAVCYGIVKEHDGWIEIDDASNGGTVFRVFLPAA